MHVHCTVYFLKFKLYSLTCYCDGLNSYVLLLKILFFISLSKEIKWHQSDLSRDFPLLCQNCFQHFANNPFLSSFFAQLCENMSDWESDSFELCQTQWMKNAAVSNKKEKRLFILTSHAKPQIVYLEKRHLILILETKSSPLLSFIRKICLIDWWPENKVSQRTFSACTKKAKKRIISTFFSYKKTKGFISTNRRAKCFIKSHISLALLLHLTSARQMENKIRTIGKPYFIHLSIYFLYETVRPVDQMNLSFDPTKTSKQGAFNPHLCTHQWREE